MATAKDIILKPIKSGDANSFVKAHHYSGKYAFGSSVNLGVFLGNKLHGVLQFGTSVDKRKIQKLVSGTLWHEFLELNRMAFDDALPRNSESRALSIAWRLFKKNAPQIKWVVSFADGTQCGDGTIYRASGFALTGINKNRSMWLLPSGEVVAEFVTRQLQGENTRKRIGFKLGESWKQYAERVGAKRLEGYQLRYIYFIDPTYRARLTVPELPYSTIEAMGAKMYKGQRPTIGDTGETDNAAQSNEQTEGASPIVSLSESVRNLRQ